MGKLGQAIDIKGSLAAKGLGKFQSWQTGRELERMGEASVGGGPSFAEGTGESFKEPRAAWEVEPGQTIGSGSVGPSTRTRQGRTLPERLTSGKSELGSGLTFDDPGQYARNRAAEVAESAAYNKESTGNALNALLKERGDTLTNPPVVGSFAEDELYDWSGDLADSSWKSGGEQISAYDIEKNKMKVLGESGYNISEESLKSIKDSRSMFRERMKEIEASVSGVKPIGRTFGLPSTTRGYDFRSVAGKRHKDMLGSLRWQNRLFGD